jgi:predicted solute-binding protein
MIILKMHKSIKVKKTSRELLKAQYNNFVQNFQHRSTRRNADATTKEATYCVIIGDKIK